MTQKTERSIPDDTLESLCKIGTGKTTCAFIGGGVNGFECMKGTSLESYIRQRVADETIGARGDNCQGAALGFKPLEKETLQ